MGTVHRGIPQARSDARMKVNGDPERWLVAARLSRMSKRDRERGDEVITGIQTQDRRATDWAQGEGHEIIHVTRDKNISGAVPPSERPELGPWLTDPVKLVQYDGIVAYDVSRLSREYYDLTWLRKWAETNRKKLYVIKDRLRWPDDRDGMLWAVAGDRADQERKDITERITRELDALREAGKLHGRPPFGYTTAGEKYDHYLVATDEGRRYVPEIYRLVIKNWSLKRVADWLNDEGIRPVSGGLWWPRNLAKLIRNPTYRGFRCAQEAVPADEVETRDGKPVRYRYADRWVERPRLVYGKAIHQCEALVDAATWKRANDALTNRPGRGRTSNNPAMLSGVLWCPDCDDSPMYRIASSRTNRHGEPYEYYRCTGRGNQRRSCGLMVRMELADRAVDTAMRLRFNTPVMEHRVVPGNEAELENRDQEIRFKMKQLSEDLPDEEYDAELARLRAERDANRATELIPDSVELVETGETYLELWERTEVPERGPWLAEHGFRVYASKAKVTVRQEGTFFDVPLDPGTKRRRSKGRPA
jgi:site-specific DNA recombinase